MTLTNTIMTLMITIMICMTNYFNYDSNYSFCYSNDCNYDSDESDDCNDESHVITLMIKSTPNKLGKKSL